MCLILCWLYRALIVRLCVVIVIVIEIEVCVELNLLLSCLACISVNIYGGLSPCSKLWNSINWIGWLFMCLMIRIGYVKSDVLWCRVFRLVLSAPLDPLHDLGMVVNCILGAMYLEIQIWGSDASWWREFRWWFCFLCLCCGDAYFALFFLVVIILHA